MNLTALARACLAAYTANMATAYSQTNVSEQFAVTGPMETKLKAALLESVEFLKLITTMDVDQIKGQVVKVGNYGIATGRKEGGRFNTTNGVDGHTYELVETDSCAAVPWATLAVWANAGTTNQFMQLMSQNATMRFALDMLRVGFNGTSVATTSDPVANPMGQDVNKGWHKIVSEKAPDQIMTDPVYFNPDATGALKDGEYKTLDAIVTELKNTLIHLALRNDPRLVVLVGSDLTAAAQTKLMNQADKPSEKVAAQQMDKSIGGLKAYTPPFFPGKRIVVTMLSNLHIYTQKNTRSRKSENVEDRKQHEDKYWRMEGYAVEEFEGYAAIDEAAMTIGAAP
ncbi:phage major capsid protein, P2 family [Shewanella xiamenensis]|uniref:phage major capsid protein, P2 family n=1 Tax=Shewanella xiamenensis TaxID=332186 RepID=UPI00217D88E6|nr:phage major capsid protein, P2 family [Shewanella xiamenensis]MCT8858341.1 phage major capsid protein, P2 family [Shewanella xiamenensis]UWG65887.1 phage major capsid protein, P2 family [Shewanella xiamenensis]